MIGHKHIYNWFPLLRLTPEVQFLSWEFLCAEDFWFLLLHDSALPSYIVKFRKWLPTFPNKLLHPPSWWEYEVAGSSASLVRT